MKVRFDIRIMSGMSDIENMMPEQAPEEAETRDKRGKYNILSPEVKLEIAKQACRYGIYGAITRNKSMKLSYSSVKRWKEKYERERANRAGILLYSIFPCAPRYTQQLFVCLCPTTQQQVHLVLLFLNAIKPNDLY